MQNQFVRMKPDADKMVVQTRGEYAIEILCVECGWTGVFEDGSTDHFYNHPCRLTSQMASTSD